MPFTTATAQLIEIPGLTKLQASARRRGYDLDRIRATVDVDTLTRDQAILRGQYDAIMLTWANGPAWSRAMLRALRVHASDAYMVAYSQGWEQGQRDAGA